MAATKVDMALDDIIKQKKTQLRGRGRGRGGNRGSTRGNFKAQSRGNFTRGSGRGGAARGSFRGNSLNRTRGGGSFRGNASRGVSRGFTRGAVTRRFQQPQQPQQIRTGPAKLTISNLEYGVTDSDIKELFQEFGDMRGAAIHYDSKGQSLGTAHVTFSRQSDAMKAVKQYNGVHLDGRPMKISIDGGQQQRLQAAAGIASARGAFRGAGGAMRRPVKRLGGGPMPVRGAGRGRGAMRGATRGSFRGASRGSFRGAGRGTFRGRGASRGTRGGARGRGRGGRGGRGGSKSAPNVADLDAELDAYANQVSK